MKKHLQFGILVTLIAIVLSGCNFSFSEPAVKGIDFKDNSSFLVAEKSLKYIQEGKEDSLIGLLTPLALRLSKPENVEWLMREGKRVLDSYDYPPSTKVYKSRNTRYSIKGKNVTEMYSFPFKHKVELDIVKYFHITVIDQQIHKLSLNNYPPGLSFKTETKFRVSTPRSTE